MTDTNHRLGQSAGVNAGHELTDVRIGSLVQFAIGLTVLCGLVFLAVQGLFRYFDSRETRLKRSELPLAVDHRGGRPPAPTLEGIDLEYAKARARLEPLRSSVMSQSQVEAASAAMALVEGKLPARKDARSVVRPPSDANSGRGGIKEGP
jgi:hypothetical protein